MYRGYTVGVVVPAYNEAGLVGTVIDTIPEYVDRIYAIDDCSTDNTWTEIQAHARLDRADAPPNPEQSVKTDGGFKQRVCPIRHETNRGVGGAIKTGYRHALRDHIDVTAVMGGDGQMDPSILDSFLDPIIDGEVDYTKGNRLHRPAYREAMPRARLVGNAILTALTRVASGYWGITDPQNGYTAISRKALLAIDLDGMYEYYGYCNDLLVELSVSEMRVADVPMPAKYDEAESSIRYREYIPKVSWLLVRNFCSRLDRAYVREGAYPLVLCYVAGFSAICVGLVAGVLGLAQDTGLTLAALANLFGVLVFSLGVVLDHRKSPGTEVGVRD